MLWPRVEFEFQGNGTKYKVDGNYIPLRQVQ